MERDPVRFVWRSAPGLNISLLAIAVVAIPSLWIVLELLRVAIDDAALGRGFESRPAMPFMRLAISLPSRLAEAPMVLFGGLLLERGPLVQALAGVLLVAALAVGAFLAGSSLIRAEVGRRALRGLELRLLDGIATAPPGAADTVRNAAALAGSALAEQQSVLGRAIGVPSLCGALLFAALSYLALLDWRLAATAVTGIAVFGWASRAWSSWIRQVNAADRSSDAALRRALSTLAENLSALAAHGTATTEQRRIATEMEPMRALGDRARRHAILLLGVTVALGVATIAGVLGLGAWLGAAGALSPGEVSSAAAAAAFAVVALQGLLRWQGERDQLLKLFAEIARQLGSFNARRRVRQAPAPLPASGVISAEDVTVEGTLRGGRLMGLDLSLSLPSRVALIGDPDSGARTFASLLGGQISPRAGHVTFSGVSIEDAEPSDRARRLAFSGGEPLLLPNSLRANILYGCHDPDAADIEDRLLWAVEVAGLRGFVYRRGLARMIDARREPGLAAAIVSARAGIRQELERSGIAHLVQPFDPARYNPHATIGENILFGVSLGDTFREENLASHPFMRSLLDREGLTKPLAELGAAIVRSDLEMFWGLPSGSAIVGRFSLLSPAEREDFEAILERQTGSQRSTASARDAARLIGLAMRYTESRQRLGLLGPELEDHLLRLRQAFQREIPKSLQPSIEFLHPDRVCSATSVLDNLLFGRIAEDQAEARTRVVAVVRHVLEQFDLTRELMRVGLQSRLDPSSGSLSPARSAAIDLARCLVRVPDNLVVEHALNDLPAQDALDLTRRLIAAMVGRGLVVVVPPQLEGAAELFDEVVTFKAGRALAGSPATNSTAAFTPESGRTASPDPVWSPQ